MRLVTYELALADRRLSIASESPPSPEETIFRAKIEQAEALVIDYVNQRLEDGDLWAATVDAWDVASAASPPPANVQAAVLIQLGELYRFRGDDVEGEPEREYGLTLHPRAIGCLYRYRDPAMA